MRIWVSEVTPSLGRHRGRKCRVDGLLILLQKALLLIRCTSAQPCLSPNTRAAHLLQVGTRCYLC